MAVEPSGNDQPPIDFLRDVQPIFKSHCWSCHGDQQREGGLRLDARSDALAGGDSGLAIVAKNSAASRLWNYVAGNEPDHLMPPDGDPLSAQQIETLRRWIDSGAQWPESASQKTHSEHWAYQPLRKIHPPLAHDDNRNLNDIDRWIRSKLQEVGLSPSPEADRITQIRRLSLDLLGLLPSIEEVDQFVADDRPNAYELLVDRLLSSPHFGERWGRHWLDMARYADSDGYEKDNARPDAYRWRDWVIDAFNNDMPYDQFTIEQLAGDLLPEPTDMQRLATAFHRQTLTNTEGGADQEQFRVEACFDRTETTGAVWLGLTLGCARCHSHKYDTISQREYYQLFAFFNNGDEQTIPIPKSQSDIAAYQEAKAKYDYELNLLTDKLKQRQAELGPALAAWEQQMRPVVEQAVASTFNRVPWNNVKVSSSASGNHLVIQDDGSFLSTGDNPPSADYLVEAQVGAGRYSVLRVHVLADASLPNQGPGRSGDGNLVLSEVILETATTADFAQPVTHPFATAKVDFEQKSYPAVDTFDDRPETGWAVKPELGKDHWLELSLQEPLEVIQPTYVRVRLRQQYGSQHTIGRFKLSLQSDWSPEQALPEKILQILAVDAAQRDDAQRKMLIDYYSSMDDGTKTIMDGMAELKKKEPAKPEVNARILVQRTENPRPTYVLRRGEFLTPLLDVSVVPGGLEVLPDFVSRQSNGDRLDLARWLVSPKNPLTPRVTVNFVWRTLFGTGIVKTVNDFGIRGDLPSHPELLDWLAVQFVGQAPDSEAQQVIPWSRKSLIKLIVMSATYRQSSAATQQLLQVDSENRWLARQNRLRVEGEIVRDISLGAAGLLSDSIGGPSVFPALPPGIAELSYAGNFKWKISDGADRFRRGMYTFFKRTSPHPNLITFDCPDANLTCVDRNRSNTPLQALVALNNESFAEAARGLARRTLREKTGSDQELLTYAFRLCLARYPSGYELDRLTQLLEEARSYYAGQVEQAKSLVGDYADPNVPLIENAAWVTTVRVLINLDEFITRE
jgi:cytochrome c553